MTAHKTEEPHRRRWRPLGPLLCAAILWAAPGLARDEASDTAAAEETDRTDTRSARWRARREEKRHQLAPYRAAWLEKQILAFEKAERPSVMHWSFHGLYPRILGLAKGSKNALGARLWRPDIGGSSLDLHASAFHSIRGYEFYDLQFGKIPGADFGFEATSALPLRSTKGDDVFELATLERPDRRGWGVYGSARYQHYTALPYFGQGPDSKREDETTYLRRDVLYELDAAYQLGKHFVATMSAGFVEGGVGAGEDPHFPSTDERFDDETAPGLDAEPDFWKLSAAALFDSRDPVGNPKRGMVIAIQFDRYADDEAGEYSFNRYSSDSRAFIPLGSSQRTLALRAYVSYDSPDVGARVPFFLQETLGGSHTLRGYRSFRFQGSKLALFQAEYRWEAIPAIELALFVDSGTVAEGNLRLDFHRLKTSWGAGLRFKIPSALLARVEWARSSEDSRFYMRFSPAW
jgi:hypothetical protein